MKRLTFCLIPLVLQLTANPVAAAGEANIIMPMDGRAPAQIYQGLGIINSVDAQAGKINLSHGPVSVLGWKAKTASYEVLDRTLLAKLKKGQKVMFTLVEVRKGQYAISEISAIK